MTDFLVIGNNVAALVSALELGRAGKSVVLLNPSRTFGAHFSGFQIEGHRFDLGMNFFEFTAHGEQIDDPQRYNPKIRNHVGKFVTIAAKYVSQFIPVRPVSSIEISKNGSFCEDYLISNKLSCFRKLSDPFKNKVRQELHDIVAKRERPLHASLKISNAEKFIAHSYAEASRANHGVFIHDNYIENFFEKVTNASSEEIPALFHRVAWGPLYYPETILLALDSESEVLPEAIFHYPETGYFASFIEALIDELKLIENVKIQTLVVDEVKYRNDSWSVNDCITSRNMVWTGSQAALLKLLAIEADFIPLKTAEISMGFAVVDQKKLNRKFTCVSNLDLSTPIYRYTNQTECSGNVEEGQYLLNFELNTSVARKLGFLTDDSLTKQFSDLLLKDEVILDESALHVFAIRHLGKCLPLPSEQAFRLFSDKDELLKGGFPNLVLLGGSSGFGSTSINDQIIQGISLGNQVG